MRDVVHAAVVVGARVIPRPEDGVAGHLELLVGVLREVFPKRLLVVSLECLDHFCQLLGSEIHVILSTG